MNGLKELPQGMPVPGQGGDEEVKKAQDEQTRRDIMAAVLDTTARERLSRIGLVSPERSRQIESIILRMTNSGQLRGRISDSQLIDLLEQMEEGQGKTKGVNKTKILYHRRKEFPNDDFDDI